MINRVPKRVLLLFILPSVLGCAIFIFLPSIFSFLLSFFNWDLISDIKFYGISNYIDLLTSADFKLIFKNTVFYAAVVTFFATFIPLILASVLNNKIIGKESFKTSYFLPFITPMIVIAMVWQWIFDPNIGLVNIILKSLSPLNP